MHILISVTITHEKDTEVNSEDWTHQPHQHVGKHMLHNFLMDQAICFPST